MDLTGFTTINSRLLQIMDIPVKNKTGLGLKKLHTLHTDGPLDQRVSPNVCSPSWYFRNFCHASHFNLPSCMYFHMYCQFECCFESYITLMTLQFLIHNERPWSILRSSGVGPVLTPDRPPRGTFLYYPSPAQLCDTKPDVPSSVFHENKIITFKQTCRMSRYRITQIF